MACAPVPKAWPGSMTTSSAPSRARRHPQGPGSARSSRDAAAGERRDVDGMWKLRQSTSGSSVVRDVDERVPDRGPHVAERGQLAGRAVEHVLDRLPVLALLQAARGQHHQLGQHELGVLARQPAPPGGSRALQHERRPAVELAPLALDEAGGAQASAASSAWPTRRPRRRASTSATSWLWSSTLVSSGSVRLATTVGAHERARGSRRPPAPRPPPRSRGRCPARPTPRPGRARRRRPARSRAARPRSPARRSRSPSRPSAVARQLLQQRQAQPRRRVRGGAEAQARLDRRGRRRGPRSTAGGRRSRPP